MIIIIRFMYHWFCSLEWEACCTTYICNCSVLCCNVGGIEAERQEIGLGDCLSFFTGASRIPPTGFDDICTLNFNNVNVFQTASTCALTLTLPTRYILCELSFIQRKNVVRLSKSWGIWSLLKPVLEVCIFKRYCITYIILLSIIHSFMKHYTSDHELLLHSRLYISDYS